MKVKNEIYAEFKERYTGLEWTQGDFFWLLEEMSSLTEITNCEKLRIPETVLWNDGIPKCILRQDGNKLIKLSSENISKRFVQQHFLQDDNSKGLHPKNVTSTKSGNLEQQLETTKNQNKGEGLKLAYHSVLRKISTKIGSFPSERYPPQLLTEKGLIDVLTKWPSEKLKKILSLHQYVNLSCANPLVVRVFYQAPLLDTNKEDVINYKSNKRDNLSSKVSETEKRIYICTEICREICDKISKENLIEILQVRGEFLTTENECWLNDAWDIIYRIKKIKFFGAIERAEKAAYLKGATKRIIHRLDIFNKSGVMGKKEGFIDQINKIMEDHSENAKIATGLKKLLSPNHAKDKSNVAFKSARTQCSTPMPDLLNYGIKYKEKLKRSNIFWLVYI